MAEQGKHEAAAALGILMLETGFERMPGDVGNPATWPFPVLFGVVPGASAKRVVQQGAAGLLPAFIEAGRALVAHGARAVMTSCGFLALFQEELRQALGVPVASSALLQVPWLRSLLPPEAEVGIITIDAASLTPAHLRAAGVAEDTPIEGCEAGREMFRVLVGGEKPRLDPQAARQDVLEAAGRLAGRTPMLGAVVLECTNMPPFARDVAALLRVPVFDAVTLGRWLMLGVAPQGFGWPGDEGCATDSSGPRSSAG